MAFLNSAMSIFSAIAPTIWAPDKMWHLLILKVFSFVVDYGWRIVVFTVLLKVLLSPLDFFQRYKMRKNQRITERLKPTMEKLQKQYGNDKQAFSRAQMELNRKEGYSYFSSCLPMIVTMVIFITLWQSMNTIASYMTFKEYVTLFDGYKAAETAVTEELGDDVLETTALEVGQDVVVRLYYGDENGVGITKDWVDKELRPKYSLPESFTQRFFDKLDEQPAIDYSQKLQSSFLWIENIWAPDVPWGDQAILSWEKFDKTVSANNYQKQEMSGLDNDRIGFYNPTTYGKVMGKLLGDTGHTKTNGLLILPIIVLLLSVGSQLISSIQQKRAGQVNNKGGFATSMKVMIFLMPALMLFFSLQYASIFTLYMAVNSSMSLLLNVLFTSIIKLSERRRASRHRGISTGSTRGVLVNKNSPIIHYVKGANPNAGAKPEPEEVVPVAADAPVKKTRAKKADKQSGGSSVKRSGRPDPNDLMSIDMRDRNKKK